MGVDISIVSRGEFPPLDFAKYDGPEYDTAAKRKIRAAKIKGFTIFTLKIIMQTIFYSFAEVKAKEISLLLAVKKQKDLTVS